MAIAFVYELASDWPPLTWLACCEADSPSIRLIHGPALERRLDWFCEAVWDGPFPEGNFDQTDLVFGSGGRCRDGGAIFVSSGSTVDRLQLAVCGDWTFVSNSLSCLCEAAEAQFDPRFKNYSEFFETINQGIERPLPDLAIAGGSIRLIYHANIGWDGNHVRLIPKPFPRRDFTQFDNYVGFLRSSLRCIAENLSSGERIRPYSWLGTISRGYDSPACASLARAAGLRRVITHDESRPGEYDDGTAIASALGLECIVVNRLAWKSQAPLEPLFLAADAQGKEIMIAGAADELTDKVLISGQGGGTAWSIHAEPCGEYLARSVHSGLSISEYRLHRGFIHLPLPFMGLRQLPDLAKLSQSAEMKPWDIGGAYSRPISRRLVEEAGVPRGIFGVSKTGASIRFLRGEDAWSKRGKRAFFRWLKSYGHKHGIHSQLWIQAQVCFLALEIALLFSRRSSGRLRRISQRVSRSLAAWIRRHRLNDVAFIWAVETVRRSYRNVRPLSRGTHTS